MKELKNLKLDKSPSQIRNPKSQIGLLGPATCFIDSSTLWRVQFKISDFGFEMGFCPISKFV